LPGMTVVVPADYEEAYESTLQAAGINGSVYLRLTRPDTEQLKDFQFSPASPRQGRGRAIFNFQIGKAQVLKKGKDLTLIVCGPIIFEAIKAMNQLNSTSIELINCHTLKPLDKETILHSVKKTKHCVTLEDHQIFGGLGSTINQLLSQNYPVPILNLGVNDRFGESARDEKELLDKFGLTCPKIAQKIFNYFQNSHASKNKN
jgi:transketolase